MPEGDTIHYAANRIRPVIEGEVPAELLTPHPRFGRDRWTERLAGQRVKSVDAHGKHLFLRFENGLTIHSHLRMTGSWRILDQGSRWPRSPRSAWLVIRHKGKEIVQFNGPVLELMTDSRTRFDNRIRLLGPDICKPEPFDYDTYLRRLREDDPTRHIGDAILDQRILAGIGNLWKVEGCFLAQVSPWRRVKDVTDDEARRIVELTRPRMQRSARDGNQTRFKQVYGFRGKPCPRCGPLSKIAQKPQGDDNRLTYWCPRCQT